MVLTRQSFWGSYPFKELMTLRWELGSLRLWIHRSKEEWNIFQERKAAEEKPSLLAGHSSRLPKDLSPHTFFSGREQTIEISPALPDLPLVIRPSNSIQVLPNQKCRIQLCVPLWVQVVQGSGKSRLVLMDEPSQVLSQTWFGETDSGELAYSLGKNDYSAPNISKPQPFEAICPLTIKNDTSAMLDFQRLCVHVQFLTLFQFGGKLFTNEVQVSFKGEEQVSQITIAGGSVKPSKDSEKIFPPRIEADKNILKQSFSFIKSLYG